MKKAISIVVMIVLLLTSFTIKSNAIGFSVYIEPEYYSIPPEGTVIVNFSIDDLNVGANGMNVFSCTLEYDETIFEEISAEDILGEGGWEVTYNKATKQLLLDNDEFITAYSTLCSIAFQLKSGITEGVGTISVTEPMASNGKIDIMGTPTEVEVSIEEVFSDVYYIDEENVIYGVIPETSVEDFVEQVYGIDNAVIKDNKGNILTSTSKIGTGTTIETADGEIYTVIVQADLNGDGLLTATDLSKVKLHIIGVETLQEPYLSAAEMNEDGSVTATDVGRLKRIIVGIDSL